MASHVHEHVDHAELHARILAEAPALLASGPLPLDELAEALAAGGVALPRHRDERADEVRHCLEADTAFVEVDDDRYGWVPALLDGVTFSTELGAEDVADSVLPLGVDCEPLAWWMVTHPPTLDGEELDVIETDDGTVLELPEGWLEPGTTSVAVRFDGEELTVVALDDPVVPPLLDGDAVAALAEALRRTFEARAVEERFSPAAGAPPAVWRHALVDALWWGLLAEPGAIPRGVVLPPMRRLLAEAGLQAVGPSAIGQQDDPAMHLRWSEHVRLQEVMDLTEGQALQVAALLERWRTAAAVADPSVRAVTDEEAATLAAGLNDPAVARVLLSTAREDELDPAGALALAEAALGRTDAQRAAGLHWLAGRALDLLGRIEEAEAHFEAAVSRPGTVFAPAAVALAAVAADRGDAARAAGLLRQADVDVDDLDGGDGGGLDGDGFDGDGIDEGLGGDRYRHGDLFGYDGGVALLAEILPFALSRPRATVGRNDPCPCGSGRKYKQCHQGRPEPQPIADRAAWLYAKARRFVTEHARRELSLVTEELARRAGGGLSFSLALLQSELPADVVLHEGGVMATFLERRAAVLPADESDLARRWLDVPRGVFQVERGRRAPLRLRNVLTGEKLAMAGMDAEQLDAELLIGRPLPVGDGWRGYAGLVAVPKQWRHQALEIIGGGEPLEIASMLGACVGVALEDHTGH